MRDADRGHDKRKQSDCSKRADSSSSSRGRPACSIATLSVAPPFLTAEATGFTLNRAEFPGSSQGLRVMRGTRSVIVGALALACGASVSATNGTFHDSADQLKASRGTISIPEIPNRAISRDCLESKTSAWKRRPM